jgi:phosphoribosylamine--glycine ligase
MKVAVIGSGAREHALVWKLGLSPKCERIYCIPGNAGTAGIAINIPIGVYDIGAIVAFCRQNYIDLVVIGSETQIEIGLPDALREDGICVFGPNRAAGQIELSKAYARQLMEESGIPCPKFGVFERPSEAISFAAGFDGNVAVKADGLALGKGVVVCSNIDQATSTITEMLHGKFGQASKRIVVEERLYGREFSAFAITDGRNIVVMDCAVDYKRLYDGEDAPMTGGMGGYSPVEFVTSSVKEELRDRVFRPIIEALNARGISYIGVIYAGMILTDDGIKVLEFNARFGDPEAQILLPRISEDLLDIMHYAAQGSLGGDGNVLSESWSTVGIVLASKGYPAKPLVGFPITHITEIPDNVLVFHGGTSFDPAKGLITSGGRVLTVVGKGESRSLARELALKAAYTINYDGKYFREDIGKDG